jgi:hypothetical protein
MEIEEIKSLLIKALVDSTKVQRLFILSLLIHNLTILGRGIYSDFNSDKNFGNKFYCLNEIQHKVSGFLMNELETADYSEKEFVDTIFTTSKQGSLENYLANSIKYTLSSIK